MQIIALQGDTVDQLCYRHYGSTQGVTEAVLEANPHLCDTPFLSAGHVVYLPELTPPTQQEMVQLWD